MFFYRSMTVMPKLPENISRIKELAYNLWFSWHYQARDLFQCLDPDLWEQVYHSPVKLLLSIASEKLQAAADNEEYLKLYRRVLADFDHYHGKQSWFAQHYNQYQGACVAYFCAEFGVHESHPTYSGGLGLLAGDHCKAASDLGIPLVGVGLLYKHGYFTQYINSEGRQEALYPYQNFYDLPVKPVLDGDQEELIVVVDLAGRTVRVKVWQMQVGRVDIYFLDTDVPQNSPADRELTARLYGGDQETRICQEFILGVGGVRALRALGISPGVWHINEGHAAFLCLERLRSYINQGLPFGVAREVVRANTVFTTHTPVPAGHDIFPSDLVDRYFQHWYGQMSVDRDKFVGLGWDSNRNNFNMTILALNFSAYRNGVTQLHAQVSRGMFNYLYPGVPEAGVPVEAVTNGVHTETWLAPPMKELLDRYLGLNWTDNISAESTWEKLDAIPDEELWQVHLTQKEQTINFIRKSLTRQFTRNRGLQDKIREVGAYFSKDLLTIGFARRFATYKRAALLFKDKERLSRLVNNPVRPVQFIFAGKAHPADVPGQELIREIYLLSQEEAFQGKIIFLENYDISLARHLVQGVDLWLNNPRRPLEASGTSGMKVAVNGGVNCSILDGWWPEAYNGQNGYAFGRVEPYTDENIQDLEDSLALYALLENEIVPAYYQRENGYPEKWLTIMKASLRTIPWYFSTERMVKEYTTRYYITGINRGEYFTKNNYEVAYWVEGFKKFMLENWHKLSIAAVESTLTGAMEQGQAMAMTAVIKPGPIWHTDLITEIVCGKIGPAGVMVDQVVPMNLKEVTAEGNFIYTGAIRPQVGTRGYTVRVRPTSPDFVHKFELPLVTWANVF